MSFPRGLFLVLSLIIGACSTSRSVETPKGTEHPAIRFRAIYLDMDGTSLSTDHNPRPATIAVLEEYRRAGGRVGLITGRIPEQVHPHLDALKPNLPLVLFNGAVVTDPKGQHPVIHGQLDLALVKEVAAHAMKGGTEPESCKPVQGMLIHNGASNHAFPASNEAVSGFLSEAHVTLPPSNAHEEQAALFASLERNPDDPVVKIMLLMDPAVVPCVEADLKKRLAGRANAFVTDTNLIEVVASGIDKSVTLRKVIAKQGLQCSDVIVFGDSGNDTCMVTVFPVSVAMENGKEETRENALFVTGRNNTDAIARIIRRLVLMRDCEESCD